MSSTFGQKIRQAGMPDALICDEGIAPTISEEQSNADDVSQLAEFLTQKLNTADSSDA